MINSYAQISAAGLTQVSVTSSLSGTVYFFWYRDGVFLARTTAPTYLLFLRRGQQAIIQCIDSLDATLPDEPPPASPRTRTLGFTRSIDAGIARYEIQQQQDAGAWAAIGILTDDSRRWNYQFPTGDLADLADYAWRIIPIDAAGNAGAPISMAAETIVRTPDAPSFSIAFDAGGGTITFS